MPVPAWVEPQLATLTKDRFSDPGWIFERKLDGERCLAFREGAGIRLLTRNQKQANPAYPELVEALAGQSGGDFVVDGEVVSFDGNATSFARLQQRIHVGRPTPELRARVPVYYYLFDIMFSGGADVRPRPLRERKRLLRGRFSFTGPLRLCAHRNAHGEKYLEQACRDGWEGLIAKRADAPYRAGRSRDWLKFKCEAGQEFVIGGYTDPQGSRSGFGALLLGYYDPGGRLTYAGKVGTGFDHRVLRSLHDELAGLRRERPAFQRGDLPRSGVHWAEPRLVAQIGFSEWTADGMLRHPRFQGLRRDKSPAEVVREPREAVNITMAASSVAVGGISVELSNAGKVFFPGDQITKGDLVGYYRDMAGRMLPYLRDRPLTMARYPDGIAGHRIVQKNVPDYFPGWVSRTEVKKKGGTLRHVLCDKPATLAYLANQACIEVHVFLSRVGRLDRPDQLVVDLDPPGSGGFDQARRCALWLRRLLEGELGLTCYVKTTGGHGLHVHVPLNRREDFDDVRAFARDAAVRLAGRHPDVLTVEQRKDKRGRRVYADIMRNAYAQTVVAPYAVRARPGAPVATPLHWDEVEDGGLAPDSFTIRTIASRLDGVGDPWAGMSRRRYGLAGPRRRLAAGAGE